MTDQAQEHLKPRGLRDACSTGGSATMKSTTLPPQGEETGEP